MSEKPVEKFKVGSVTATVWLNTVVKDAKTYENYSIGVIRSYKNKEGEWKETSSYAPSDLPKIALACAKAYEYVMTKKKDAENDD